MNLNEMTIDELLERRNAIVEELDAEGADLDALEVEMKSINTELDARKAAEAKKEEIRAEVANGAGEVTETFETKENTKMDINEIRNSAEYIDAFAEYIKTNNADECRALLTENVSGTVAVPDFVYEITKTAWAKEGIMSRVRKAYVKGNLKVGFEISGTDAALHTEGGEAVAEETLVLGIVKLTPISIKKWISISDEVYDLRGEAFLRYIYEELAYRIAKKAADQVIAAIEACGTVSTTTCPGIPKIKVTTASIGTVAEAIGNLSDAATNPCIIMNKLTYSTFKNIQYTNNYAVDPFEGLPVVFSDKVTAYSAATTGVTYMIVGDLGEGALANFPAGEEIELKFDDKTLMTSDLIRILGREYVGIGVVAPGAFVKVTK